VGRVGSQQRGPSYRKPVKPHSAEAILKLVLKELGYTRQFNANKLTGEQHHEILESVRSLSRAWLRSEAEEFARQFLQWDEERGLVWSIQSVSDDKQTRRAFREQATRWIRKVKQFVRESIVAGVMGLVGPRPLTGEELQDADRLAQYQEQFLNTFEQKLIQIPPAIRPEKSSEVIVIAPQWTPLMFIARAEMYGDACYAGAINTARATAIRDSIFVEERRIHPLAFDDLCATCREQRDYGWVPIGTLDPIGDSECLNNCHCSFLFRDADGNDYNAGRGPLSLPAFGET